MNKIDDLRAEMRKRGFNKSQTETKSVAVAFDIVTNSGDKYTKVWKEECDASEKLSDIEREIRRLGWEVKGRELRLKEMEGSMDIIRERQKEYEEYIEKFNKSLFECETKEGKDTMRIAQMFVNSIDVKTAYDNTAYIIGLASILSKGEINAIEGLKKINKDLPTT